MTSNTKAVQLGQVLFSMGINELIAEIPSFSVFIMNSLQRHKNCDWGECCNEDKKTNEEALIHGSRLFSSYKIPDDLEINHDKVWIITEWNRTVTTIMFPNEY